MSVTQLLARRQRAEGLAAILPPLLVAAERIAATVTPGVHGRRRVGPGETFWQFRRYQPGDSRARIDWRQSAKTDPLFVREMEWSAAQSVWLWRDGSPSMRYRSSSNLTEKLERAELLALALVALLVRGGERVALLGDPTAPATGRAALNRLALTLAHGDAPHGAPADSLPPSQLLPRHAHLVLIGDFLSPLPTLEARLRGFAERGVKGHLLQVLDPAERSLPFLGRIRFEGLEREGETLLSRVETVREDYQARLERHCAALAAIARSFGWSFATTTTDHPPQSALLALYLRLSAAPRR
jgi:uncharacterized protein (DUF58 family)